MICNKGFFQKGHYKGHLVSHKGIKRFKCEDCNKEFSNKTVLQRHKKICTKYSKISSKEPSVCHICEEKFKTIYGLKEHVEEKHGENMHYLGSEYKQRESLCYQKRSCSILLQNSNEEPNIETGKQCCKEMVDSSVESDMKAVDEGEDENVQEQPMIVSTEHLMSHVVDHEIKSEDFSDDLPFHQVSSFRSKRKGTTIEDKSMSKGDNLDIAESKEMFKDLNSVSKIKTVLSSEWPKFGSDLHLKSNDSNFMKYGYFHSKTCEHSLQCHNYSKCQKCHNCLFIFSNIKDREVIKTDKRTIKHSHGSFTNKMIYRCQFCSKAFSIRVILRRHKKYCVKLKLKKADSFKCEICRSLFFKENTLRKHYSQNHGKTLLYRCSCGFIFRWRKAFRSHQQNCLSRLKDTKTTEFSQNKVVEMDSMIKKIYEIVSHSFHGNKPETMVTPSDRISPRSETQGLDNQETEGIKTEGQQGKTVLNALPSLYTKCNTCQTTSGSSFGKNMDSVDCPHYYCSDLSNQECTVVKNNIQDSSCCHSDMAQSERSTYGSKEDFKRDISVKHGTNAAKSTSGRNRVKGLGYKDQLHYKNPLENETVQSRTSFSNGTVVITLSEDTQHQDVHDKDKSPVDETERVLQNSNTGSCIDLTFSEEENSCHGSSSEGDQSHQYVSGKYNDANYKLSSECLKLLNNQCSSFVDNPLHVRMFKKRTNHYFCRFCNKYFLYKTVYQNHMKLHKNDKTVTSKHFSGGSSEQNQDFYLSNTSICKPLDKKHTCKICGDTFKGIGSLKEHTSGLHGTVDRYQCNCGRSFKWRSSLGMHKQKCKESNNAFSVNGSAKHSKNVKKVSSNLNNGLMVNMKMQMYEETRPGTILNETDNYEETLSYNELTHSSTDTFQSGHPECETTESLQSGDVTYDTRETDQSRNITYDTTGTYQSEESVYAGPDQSEHSMYFTTKTSQSGDLEYETRKNNQYENFDYNNAEMIQLEQTRNMSQETEVFKIETDDNIGLKIKTENNDVNDIEYCMNPLDNQNISVVQEKESENCSSYEKAQTLEISHIVKNVSASFNMTEGRSQTDCTDYGPASEMASNISVNYEQLYYTGGQILSRSLDHTMTQNSIDQGSVITNYLDWKSLQFQPKSKTSVSPYKRNLVGIIPG
ncbi:hypothetical protein KUTeg_010376 [Tegillarca granosa]|uniref:C2H2-type domain-containing protein n=1 Tax=Tegillarca granosa TaxID=220873 RepID=A0ABQ9FBG9_TEGGR|nr:hypothetical protein KUTeg_010376 [Tegillarca granosa]